MFQFRWRARRFLVADRDRTEHHGLHLLNGAEHVGRDWWRWWVWLEGPDEVLDRVESVRYALHPTFPNPVRLVTDRASKFRLESSGWGEFSLAATVTMKDGMSFPLERWLDLGVRAGEEAETRRPSVFASFSVVDRPLVDPLLKRLESQGIAVITPADVPAGDEWSSAIVDGIQRADLVAIVTGGELRGWAEEEFRCALDRGKPVVSVSVGSSEVPDSLRAFSGLRLRSPADLDAVGDAIASRVKDVFYPDER
jgi:hypothetical protein